MQKVESAINPALGDNITFEPQPYLGEKIVGIRLNVDGNTLSLRVNLPDLEKALEKLKKEEK